METERAGEKRKTRAGGDEEHIARIMKKILPPDATISPDAIRMTQACVNTLIACISTEAGTQTLASNRKLVSGADVAVALDNMGFIDSGELVRVYLTRYQLSKQNSIQR